LPARHDSLYCRAVPGFEVRRRLLIGPYRRAERELERLGIAAVLATLLNQL
jgi:hypothetical protein